jgi:hypothetical protein
MASRAYMGGQGMQRSGIGGRRHGSTTRRFRITTAMAVAGMSLVSLVGIQVAGYAGAGAAPPASAETGFTQPFSGTPSLEKLGPPELTRSDQLNQPIGQATADAIARQMGLSRQDAFTQAQYLAFISGKGLHGSGMPDQAAIVDASVRIFTNTVGRPLVSNVDGHLTPTVLASYGLFVSTDGQLESLANKAAPTRAANKIIAPGGYLGTWCAANGAERSLLALYRSAYTAEVVYGVASQSISGEAQLVKNDKNGAITEIGMSMAPSIWLVNFALLYVLNPAVAAEMPANWAPIPSNVANAILASPSGLVPYSEFASDLQQ